MTKPDTAMVLAAGFGTRMGELTETTPKPLLRANGRALLDIALDHCAAAGVRRAVINLHYRGEQIRDHLSDRDDLQVLFSEERPEILETGGGVVHAQPLLGDLPFFVLNSDAVFSGENPLMTLARAWDPSRMDALLHLIPREETRAYTRPGDFFLSTDGRPTRRGKAETADFVYTGAQLLSPSALADAPNGAFSMNIIWDRLLSSGRLSGVRGLGPWVDVGTPAGLETATQVLQGATA